MSKYLDQDGLLYLWNSKIKPALAKYLPLAGGTMTGKLKLSGAPTEDMDAATKKYVDDSVGNAGGDDLWRCHPCGQHQKHAILYRRRKRRIRQDRLVQPANLEACGCRRAA